MPRAQHHDLTHTQPHQQSTLGTEEDITGIPEGDAMDDQQDVEAEGYGQFCNFEVPIHAARIIGHEVASGIR